MKVLCIQTANHGFNGSVTKILPELGVYFGETYTVLDEVYSAFNLTDKAYILEERPLYCRYKIKHFIPLSDLDETELVNEKVLSEII